MPVLRTLTVLMLMTWLLLLYFSLTRVSTGFRVKKFFSSRVTLGISNNSRIGLVFRSSWSTYNYIAQFLCVFMWLQFGVFYFGFVFTFWMWFYFVFLVFWGRSCIGLLFHFWKRNLSWVGREGKRIWRGLGEGKNVINLNLKIVFK